jgi:hypothetical protein
LYLNEKYNQLSITITPINNGAVFTVVIWNITKSFLMLLDIVNKTDITFLIWLQSLVHQSWCLFIPRILFAYYYCLVVQLVSLGPFKWFECSSAVYSTVHVDVYICFHFLLCTSMVTFFTFFAGKNTRNNLIWSQQTLNCFSP